MNIFWLSWNITLAARMLCDQHIVKMALEAAQIAYSVLYLVYKNENKLDLYKQIIEKAPFVNSSQTYGYKPCFLHHPCVKWAAICNANFKETLKMGKAITDEYTNRYNKTHSVAKHLDFLNSQILPYSDKTLNFLPMTRPFVASPDIYKVYDIKDKTIDVINSYKNYYISDKAHWCRYRYTTPVFIFFYF